MVLVARALVGNCGLVGSRHVEDKEEGSEARLVDAGQRDTVVGKESYGGRGRRNLDEGTEDAPSIRIIPSMSGAGVPVCR